MWSIGGGDLPRRAVLASWIPFLRDFNPIPGRDVAKALTLFSSVSFIKSFTVFIFCAANIFCFESAIPYNIPGPETSSWDTRSSWVLTLHYPLLPCIFCFASAIPYIIPGARIFSWDTRPPRMLTLHCPLLPCLLPVKFLTRLISSRFNHGYFSVMS